MHSPLNADVDVAGALEAAVSRLRAAEPSPGSADSPVRSQQLPV